MRSWMSASWEPGFNYGGAGAQTSLDFAKSTLPDIPEGVAPEATNIVSSDAKQYWIVYGTPSKDPSCEKTYYQALLLTLMEVVRRQVP